jgi:hypothetical protein
MGHDHDGGRSGNPDGRSLRRATGSALRAPRRGRPADALQSSGSAPPRQPDVVGHEGDGDDDLPVRRALLHRHPRCGRAQPMVTWPVRLHVTAPGSSYSDCLRTSFRTVTGLSPRPARWPVVGSTTPAPATAPSLPPPAPRRRSTGRVVPSRANHHSALPPNAAVGKSSASPHN